MSLEFHPGVQGDVNEIIAYYEREAGVALADRFFTALQKQLAEIDAHPERCSPYPPNPKFQRAFIPRFPHIILFRMKAGRPRVTVIKHQSQHPRRGLACR